MKMNQIFIQFPFLIIFFVHLNPIVAQSPAAAPAAAATPPTIAPAAATIDPHSPPLVPGLDGPMNITAVLEKAGHFHTFIGLLKSTETAYRINDQLNTSGGSLTIFAPSDSAFSNMEKVTLNTLSSQQQSELVHFHILPSFYSLSLFERVRNPLSTEAGDTHYGQFPMNVTSTGNSMSIKTGITNSSVTSIVYTDGQLAVYEVDHVLLPQKFFITPPPVPAPAPAPTTPKAKKAAPELVDTARAADSSDAIALYHKMFGGSFAAALVAAFSLFL